MSFSRQARRHFGPVGVGLLVILFMCGESPAGNDKLLVVGIDGVRADSLITSNTIHFDRLISGNFGGADYNTAYAYYAQTIQDSTLWSNETHTAIMSGVTYATHGGDWATYPHFL